jgi:hypothetical protein
MLSPEKGPLTGDTPEDPAAALRRLTIGFQVSEAIHVAATFGVADHVAAGVHDCADLAAATETDPEALYRVLRALAAVGVFVERDDRHFDLTPVGEHLRSDASPSLRGWASFIGRPYYWQAWSGLIESVQTGENAFQRLHGVSAWEYRAAHPDDGAIFDRAMAGLTRQVTAAVLTAYDFARFGCVADVGGGSGAFLVGLLSAYANLSAVLFDQPHVIANVDPALAGELADRCTVIGGDFFVSVPAGADAYVVKSVLHDWPDAEAVTILESCRAAGGAGSTLLIVERALGDANAGADNKFSDLNMLVVPGGQERTVEAYHALLEPAGYRLDRVIETASPMMILEALAT